MSSKESKSLQKLHEDLLRRQVNLTDEDKQAFVDDVKGYIAQTKKSGANVALIQEREQLRANLRYWANYLYGVDGILPDTDLAPYTSRKRFLVISFGMLAIIVIVILFLGLYLGRTVTIQEYSDAQWTAIAQTQQVMEQPLEEKIKNWFNSPPFDYNIFNPSAQYEIIGVSFPKDYYFQVDVNCECVSGSNCCDPEKMFVFTLQRLGKYKEQILPVIASTVKYMNVVCYDHNRAFAVIYAPWEKVEAFLNGEISASELASSVSQRSIP
jgi:hypothetical protein